MDTSTKYITTSTTTGDTTFITGNLCLQKSNITDVGSLITGNVPFTLNSWPLQFGSNPTAPINSDAQQGYRYLDLWGASASATTWTNKGSKTLTNHGTYYITGKVRFNYAAGTDASTKAAVLISNNSTLGGTAVTYTDLDYGWQYESVEYVNSQLNKSVNFSFVFRTQELGLQLYLYTASSNGTSPTDGGFYSITRLA